VREATLHTFLQQLDNIMPRRGTHYARQHRRALQSIEQIVQSGLQRGFRQYCAQRRMHYHATGKVKAAHSVSPASYLLLRSLRQRIQLIQHKHHCLQGKFPSEM
jgi:hypothetical protein